MPEGHVVLHELAPTIEQVCDELVEIEHRAHQDVDSIIKSFAQSDVWPDMTEEQRLMLCLRLEWCAGFSFTLGKGQTTDGQTVVVQPSTIDKAALLEWLLIRAWHNGGFSQIHGTCESLTSAVKASRNQRFHENN